VAMSQMDSAPGRPRDRRAQLIRRLPGLHRRTARLGGEAAPLHRCGRPLHPGKRPGRDRHVDEDGRGRDRETASGRPGGAGRVDDPFRRTVPRLPRSKRFDCARRRRWAGTRVGPGVAEWDAEARTYDKNLDELKGRIDAFDAAGATLSTYFAAESSDDEAARHELLDRMHGYTDRATPASGHEPSSQTSTAEGPVEGPVGNERRPEPGGDPQEQTPPPAAQKTPAYERSRASDMNGADPQHVQTRLDVAKSFIHPIRTYTTGRSKNRWRQQHRHPVAAPATQARQVKSLTYVDLRTSTEARRPRWRRARRNPLLSVPADKQSNTTERGDSDG
jgi:hypothetical protein